MAIITISRGTYSGGKQLAECVASTLGYRCIAEEILLEAAKAYGIAIEKLKHAIKSKPGMFERMSNERLQALTYVSAVLFQNSGDENVVYHGHGGHFLLKEIPHILKIRLLADMEYRINAAMRDRNLSRDQAIKYIHRADAIRAKWTRFLFHTDVLDLSLYDMVINLEHTSLDNACALVCEAAGEIEFQPTPASQKAIKDIALTYHIKSKLVGLKPNVEVQTDDGVVHIMTADGTRCDVLKIEIENIVQSIPEVKQLHIESTPAGHLTRA